jgi:ADP-ribose pyrophosphatase
VVSHFNEETLAQNMIHHGKIIQLMSNTVRLPNQKNTTRDVVIHPGAVALLPVYDNNIILVRQYRYAIQQVTLELPAGTLRESENPEECAHRELMEETGYSANRLEKLFECYLAPGYSSEHVTMFLATDLSEQRQDLDEDEFIQVVIVTLPEAIELIHRNKIMDTKTIAGILYFKLFKQNSI